MLQYFTSVYILLKLFFLTLQCSRFDISRDFDILMGFFPYGR